MKQGKAGRRGQQLLWRTRRPFIGSRCWNARWVFWTNWRCRTSWRPAKSPRAFRSTRALPIGCSPCWRTSGYVERSAANGKYSLGMKLIELGTRASSRLDLCELAGPVLDRLMERTGETAHIGILSQGAVISIADSESYKTLRTPSTVGRRNPAHCSSQGKVLMAGLSSAELRAFIGANPLKKFTRRTISTLTALQREVAQVRQQGYAIDDQEFEEGLKCVGAPIRDRFGNVVAAISVAGPAMRLSEARMPDLIGVVVDAAAGLSRALGYQASPPADSRAMFVFHYLKPFLHLLSLSRVLATRLQKDLGGGACASADSY